jgi:hypothetical protein
MKDIHFTDMETAAQRVSKAMKDIHCKDRETEAQRGEVIYTKSNS